MRKPFPEPVIVRGRRWFRSPLGWLWILVVILGAALVVYGLGRAGIGPGAGLTAEFADGTLPVRSE